MQETEIELREALSRYIKIRRQEHASLRTDFRHVSSCILREVEAILNQKTGEWESRVCLHCGTVSSRYCVGDMEHEWVYQEEKE